MDNTSQPSPVTVSDPKTVLEVLADNPNILVLVINLAGTGLTAQDLKQMVASLVSRPQNAAHQTSPAAYERFCRKLKLQDDLESRDLFQRLAQVSLPVSLPGSKEYDLTNRGIDTYAHLCGYSLPELTEILWRTKRSGERSTSKNEEQLVERTLAKLTSTLRKRFGVELASE